VKLSAGFNVIRADRAHYARFARHHALASRRLLVVRLRNRLAGAIALALWLGVGGAAVVATRRWVSADVEPSIAAALVVLYAVAAAYLHSPRAAGWAHRWRDEERRRRRQRDRCAERVRAAQRGRWEDHGLASNGKS
jgi:membrane protein implicated in regulation of membrane protease activity